LSAFVLSSLPTPLARKQLVKEMWESGAGVMILIDHNSTSGFECVAEAREQLLRMGQKEIDDPETEGWDVKGSHVVAPCPHDGACPLYHPGSSKLVCGFSQRLQRPAFVRKTKHSGVGHEDAGYSYVVIRRGTRPKPVTSKTGRIGYVGKQELDKIASSKAPLTELLAIEDDNNDHIGADLTGNVDSTTPESPVQTALTSERQELEATLRLEAYNWPRLVFPPLKRSGHVILDSCTAEGKIMRMTIPKSQGKQPYYDARKSGWGDIFPHEPKNAPQERYQPTRAKTSGEALHTKGEDIGKRKKAYPQAASYIKLSNELKEQKQKRKQRSTRREDTNAWEEY